MEGGTIYANAEILTSLTLSEEECQGEGGGGRIMLIRPLIGANDFHQESAERSAFSEEAVSKFQQTGL